MPRFGAHTVDPKSNNGTLANGRAELALMPNSTVSPFLGAGVNMTLQYAHLRFAGQREFGED